MPVSTTSHFTSQYLIETWSELVDYLLQHPENIMGSQLNYYQSYLKLCHELNGENELFESLDKRFRDESWKKNLIFDFIRRSYLLLSQHVDDTANAIDFNDEKIAKKFRFFSRQFIDSLSPSNFIHTNPEVLNKMFETNGINLINGFKQMQEDLQQGKDIFLLSNTDSDAFTLGENIACTP